MSTIKADTVTTKSDDTDLTITGGGTGVPNLEAGFKVGGSAGVPTASIQDDAVTLAKMASGTDGVIITYDASGNPVHVGPGTDGQVLTSTGAGSPPAFEAAGGGAWTLIGTSVASAASSMTVTGLDSTYDTYAIGISDLVRSGDNGELYLRLGDSSGIDSGASDYAYSLTEIKDSSGSSAFTARNDPDRNVILLQSEGGNASEEGFGAMLFLHTPGDATTRPIISGNVVYIAGDGSTIGGTLVASRTSSIVTTQVQVLTDGGTITGRLTVWGISHA